MLKAISSKQAILKPCLFSIAETNADAFYNGSLTKKIVDYSKKHGGFLSLEDFAEYEVDWVTPISVNYKGYDVYELPPNGQVIVALMALSMLNNDHFVSRDHTETIHHQIEALKLAFADGFEYITDQKEMQINNNQLLNALFQINYADAFEPYVVLPVQDIPKYDERLIERMGNKIAYTLQLYAMG